MILQEYSSYSFLKSHHWLHKVFPTTSYSQALGNIGTSSFISADTRCLCKSRSCQFNVHFTHCRATQGSKTHRPNTDSSSLSTYRIVNGPREHSIDLHAGLLQTLGMETSLWSIPWYVCAVMLLPEPLGHGILV